MRIRNIGLSILLLALGLGCLRSVGSLMLVHWVSPLIGERYFEVFFFPLVFIQIAANPVGIFLIGMSIFALTLAPGELGGWIRDYRSRHQRMADVSGKDLGVNVQGKDYDRLFG
jgi:hypothetical protein